MSAPPFTGDLRTWARQLVTYLNRSASKLLFKAANDTPSENGIMRWDETDGHPIVSKDGVWTEVALVVDDAIRLQNPKTPASASATGVQGQIAWDANYIYVCTATDTWKRVAIATW